MGGSYLLCNLVKMSFSLNSPPFHMFPVKIFDSLGTRRDRQLTVESRAWANSANTQQGGLRPHGGCLSVTGGINTPPTLNALQKRHGCSNSCDMQPVPRDSGMNNVYLWPRWKKGWKYLMLVLSALPAKLLWFRFRVGRPPPPTEGIELHVRK